MLKRAADLLLALIMLVSAAACGDTEYVDVTTRMKQDQERREQAGEIASILNTVLVSQGIMDVEVKSANTSGSIYVSAEILDEQFDRTGFGYIASLLGDRFIELIDEYSEYSFDCMTLFYYNTGRNGVKRSKPSLIYNINADDDGIGYLIDSDGDNSMEYFSPEDVYAFLSA